MKNAESLGANVIKAENITTLTDALEKAKKSDKVTVIYIETDLEKSVEGYGWWDVAIAEVSEMDTVQRAYKDYIENKKNQKYYL